MAQDNRRDTEMPNLSSNMEPAEGSRETVRNRNDEGTGITNRGRDREMSEQQELPERGHTKDESDNLDSEG
jgi:hypothetical protein